MALLGLLFGFNGRINRAQYWAVSFAVGFVFFVLCVSLFMMSGVSLLRIADPNAASLQPHELAEALSALLPLVPLAGIVTWIGTALNVKRLHDRGQSGFWALLPFGVNMLVGMGMLVLVPISFLIGLAFLINLGFLPGDAGENRFGGPPSGAPSGPQNSPRPAAANTMLGAEAAMERALAEQKLRTATPAPAARAAMPVRQPNTGQPSFGRRPAH